jgi:uncharacterized protein YkwD
LFSGCAGEQQDVITTPSPIPTQTPTHLSTPTPFPTQTPTSTPVPTPNPKEFSFYFYVEGTRETLDGEVYLNGGLLGKTRNGKISLLVNRLSPGIVVLKGNYSGKPFEFEFELNKSDLQEYSGIDYYVLKEDIKRLIFDASQLNTSFIEREILRFVNLEREKANLRPYKWNDWVRAVAYNHSKDMAERDYFAHTSPEGKDHYDRLKEREMFFLASGEVLFYLENIGPEYNETEIARAAVKEWLKSPGHRSVVLDVDNIYSDAGIGVYCEEDRCFITMNVVGLEKEYSTTLDVRYAAFYYVYDPGLGFDMKVPVSVSVKSSRTIDVYIVPNKEQYERFLKSWSFEKLYWKGNTKTFEKTFEASIGTGIIVYSDIYNDVEVNVKIRYYP